MPIVSIIMIIATIINIGLYTWLSFTIGWYTVPVVIALHIAFYPINRRIVNNLYRGTYL